MIIEQVYLYVDVRPHERYSIAYNIANIIGYKL